jgi:hypothetical protein
MKIYQQIRGKLQQGRVNSDKIMASVLLAVEDEKISYWRGVGLDQTLKLGITHLLPRLDEATDLVGGGDDILQAMTHLLGRCAHVPAPFKHTCHADQTHMPRRSNKTWHAAQAYTQHCSNTVHVPLTV